MKKNWFFILLLSIASLALAGTAAYFSVFGISKLFYAAGLGIIILAASLEFAKLVTVSYVYRFWKTIKKGLRGFYIFAVVFIMILTSIGIYGFLTGAYQQTANKIEMRDSQIEISQNKRQAFVNQLDRVNSSIQSSTDRINVLSDIRKNQETRLDSLYSRNYVTYASRTESQITSSDEQIKALNEDIAIRMREYSSINDSIAFYDIQIIELRNSDISNEIGPYKFVADLTGLPINSVVNIVALLIILVFDPLAIALLVGVNQLTLLESEGEKKSLFKKKEQTDINVEEKEKEVEDFSTPVSETPITFTTSPTTTPEPLVVETTTAESSIEPQKSVPVQTTTTMQPTTTIKPKNVQNITTQNAYNSYSQQNESNVQKVASVKGRINN